MSPNLSSKIIPVNIFRNVAMFNACKAVTSNYVFVIETMHIIAFICKFEFDKPPIVGTIYSYQSQNYQVYEVLVLNST